ncbi:hypothetical protein [Advenella mimigardefordensis]|uniref:SCP2 domain-containing protein n=1 Tax=Advenella mimigardefordensis (strain DSM 17166 / LMG 22922 / DPN7) TaxID=1247726 RepID=W0PE56_ADVMD|nr:hypothetical protein [Advenella mimigardefordensis]AHG65169.1 hypothetical protein MIM_c31050 [Advenella mimigardefordensis DPN7]
MLSDEDIIAVWPARLADREHLVWKGRHLKTSFLFALGERRYLVAIREGQMHVRAASTIVMPQWDFALRADEHVWHAFFQPVPPPEYHDLLAMMKCRRLIIEGNIYAFMSHLLFFKALFTLLRSTEK